MAQNKEIIVRFPPSPTGFLHIGGVRTILYNYLFAKKNGGKLVLRMEDTDKERSKIEYEEDIIESIKWLGLEWDNEKIQRQSERTEIYKQKIQELIKKGAAYIAEESADGKGNVVRFKNPGGKITFEDMVRDKVEMEVGDIADFVIAKNIEEPLYHLAVVVDDAEMGVTHVIRGEDHISNTPRQILILEALGYERPIYAHLPLILAPDKSKLSKRKHGESVSVKFYRERGYEPKALLNFMALIGWNPGTEQEIFSIEELLTQFEISKVQKKGGVFDMQKLDWINREHILKQDEGLKVERLKTEKEKTKFKNSEKWQDEIFVEKFLKLLLDRIHRWGEAKEAIEGEFGFLFEAPKIEVSESEKIIWKKSNKEETVSNLKLLIEKTKDKGVEEIKKVIKELAEEKGRGDILWPVRFALSGLEKSPDPFSIIDILGATETQTRLRHATETLENE